MEGSGGDETPGRASEAERWTGELRLAVELSLTIPPGASVLTFALFGH